MASFDVKLTGDAEFLREMRRFGADGRRALDTALKESAVEARSNAVRSIQRGPKTGRAYPPVRGRRGQPHQASAPGQAPATDTGRLAQSIRWVKDGDDYLVGTELEYGEHLEFGTSRMQPRPWLVPAVAEAVRGLNGRALRALRRLRGG